MMVRFQGKLLLVDCGEGTQISLKSLGWGFKEISVILITHMHADHVAGLPGLLLSMGNSGRTDWLLMYGPRELSRVMQGVRAIAPHLPFPVEWQELDGGESLDLFGLDVSSLAVEHGVPCLAYSFTAPRAPRFNPERATALGIPVQLWSRLQSGKRVEWSERTIDPSEVLGEERRGIKLSYTTDTRPVPELPGFVRESDLFVCEGMYGSSDERAKAEEKGHMTFAEAAEIARAGMVRELWLTHYSPSLADPEEWLEEATRIFPNARCGYDRISTTLAFSDDGRDT